MNKLTFVSTKIPFPPDKDGYTENIFHIIKSLKENFTVTIEFIVFQKQKNNDSEKAFKKHVDKLIFRPHISRYLFPFIPFIYKNTSVSNPVFFCDFNAGYYQSVFKTKHKILYSADSPTFYYNKRKGIKSKLFYLKYILEESILYPNFANIIFVSNQDEEFSKKRTQNKGITIPIGYNLDRIKISEQKEYDVIFSGNFNYTPNYEAAELFLNSIFNKLLLNFPEVRVCFVGRKPSEIMRYFAKEFPDNIIVTGEVESVEVFLGRSRIYVSLLQSGSGMKNKILQAMAAQLPLVATPESMSGFTNFDIEGVFIAKKISDVLSLTETLLKEDEGYLLRLGRRNQAYFIENYSWKAILVNYYQKILCLNEN